MKPILFSAPMVNAILAGTKTQTRRIVGKKLLALGETGIIGYERQLAAPTNIMGYPAGTPFWRWVERGSMSVGFKSPYGMAGDRLWVRETWRTEERVSSAIDGIRFAADDTFVPIENTRAAADLWVIDHDNGRHGKNWRPSIFMRPWASRISLEITNVRIERLQDITEEDAVAEGCPVGGAAGGCTGPCSPLHQYEWLWDHINEKRAPWKSNPFVWVVEFKRAA